MGGLRRRRVGSVHCRSGGRLLDVDTCRGGCRGDVQTAGESLTAFMPQVGFEPMSSVLSTFVGALLV